MSDISILVDFKKIHSHNQLVTVLSPAFGAKIEDAVFLSIDLNSYSYLYADYLLLIVSMVTHLNENQIRLKCKFIGLDVNSKQVKYASRANFFGHLGFKVGKEYQQSNSTGNLIGIRQFSVENALNIYNDVMNILINDEINEDMLTVLQHCLWEVIDNTLNHSGPHFKYGSGTGFICCQYFQLKKQIRLLIADNGIGIYRALTKHPQSKYSHLNEAQAVFHSIDKGVTNSEGMGFGLWATAQLIKENGGVLVIHSGSYAVRCSLKREVTLQSNWQGTYTFLKINTDIPVNHEVIFGKTSTKKDEFDELKEQLFESLDDLW